MISFFDLKQIFIVFLALLIDLTKFITDCFLLQFDDSLHPLYCGAGASYHYK